MRLSTQEALARRGFTLIEMLVVVGIISVLAAMLLPALGLARESARNAKCQNNLREFGITMHAFAEKRNEQLSTGAFDWVTDGAVTEIGWVADQVSLGVPVGKMTCPSNPALVAETYVDLLSTPASGFGDPTCVNRIGSPGQTLPDGSLLKNPCRMIIETPGLASGFSEDRRKFVEEKIFKRNYNTNYTASWFLCRGEAILTVNGNLLYTKGASCGTTIQDRNTSRGPMRRAQADTAKVSSSLIPVLGDGGISNRTLPADLDEVPSGSVCTAAMTGGPALKVDGSYGSALSTPTFSGAPKSTWWAVWNDGTLQDYRQFGVVHRDTCNILFADGSVRPFTDTNKDDVLNNGFPAVGGFSTDQVELDSDDIFSRHSVDAIQK